MKALIFPASGLGKFCFRTWFDEFDFANVTFFDKQRKYIPFHISLRPREGIVSLNHCDSLGWGQERHYDTSLLQPSTHVEIIIKKDSIDIRIDGSFIFLNRGNIYNFCSLDKIAFVEHHGA